MFDYNQLKEKVTFLKENIPLLECFFQLENIGIFRFDGKKGKKYFFGFYNQKTGSILINERTKSGLTMLQV